MTENVQKNRKEEQAGQSRGLERHQSPFAPMRHDPFWQPHDFFTSSPFGMMRRFAENMERVFHNWESDLGRERSEVWAPAVDVSQQGDNLLVRADLPGMKSDDVKVETVDNVLVIQGERRQEHEEEQGGYHRSERRYGSFYRAIPLPEGAQAEQARAEFKDGVLQISVPYPAAQRRTRQIPISTATAPERKETASAGATAPPKVSKAG